jgi:hypothetical protein
VPEGVLLIGLAPMAFVSLTGDTEAPVGGGFADCGRPVL